MDDNDKKEELEINNEEVKHETVEVVKEEPKSQTQSTIEEPKKDKKGLAIAAMVLGIVSLVLFCIWYISLPCAILALVFGILSLKSSKRGMAIAGVVTGAVGFILMVVLYVFIFFVIGISTYSGLQNLQNIIDEYEDYNYNYNYNNYNYDDYENWF